jgi:hypothetical protein
MDASLSRVTKIAIHDRLVSAIILSSVGLPHVGSQIFQKNPFRLCKLDYMKPDYVRLWQTFSFCIWFYLPAVGDVYTLLLIGYYLVVFGYLLVHLIAATLPVDSLYCLLRFPPVLVL